MIRLGLLHTWFTLALLAAAESPASGSEPVEVVVKSGRRFAGRVDVRSTDRQLWLRTRIGSTALWRPIDWTRIVEVTADGRPLTKQDVLARASELADSIERNEVSVTPSGESMAEAARRTLQAVPDVRSVEFTARLGNWNAGAAADGWIVDLQTLAFDGSLVPVAGTAEITFYTTRYRTARRGARRGGREVRQIGRWTRAFTADEMARGLRIELPFGAVLPEWDRSWAPYGLVTVRVAVPGHGVFTRSHDFVRTRPIRPTRDRHARVTGSPFFPGE